MIKWEYTTIKLEAKGWFVGGNFDKSKLDAEMNALGESGWELVSAFSTSKEGGGSRDIVGIFKREK